METRTGPSIVTPEAVVLDFETAGIGSRILATLIDWLIIATTVWVFVLMVAIVSSNSGLGTTGIVLVVIGITVIVFGYPIVSEVMTRGRTAGKAALGLRVLTIDGGPIRFRHAVIRSAMIVPDFLLTGGGLAVVVALGNQRNQRLGDLAAGTFVVRDRQAGTHAGAVSFVPPYGYEQYAAGLEVSSVTPDQYGVIRSFLLRVAELSPTARSSLTWRIANPLAWQIGHQPPPNVHPETFLVCVAAAYQRANVPRSATPAAPPPAPPPGYAHLRPPGAPIGMRDPLAEPPPAAAPRLAPPPATPGGGAPPAPPPGPFAPPS